MFGIEPRTARIAWTTALVLAGVVALYFVRRTLFVFALAVFVAYLLAPLVDVLGRFVQTRFGRAYTVVIAFSLVTLVIAVGIAAVGPLVGTELTALADQLPELARKVQQGEIPLPGPLQRWQDEIGIAVRQGLDHVASIGLPFAQDLARDIAKLMQNLVLVILVPILAFLFLKDGPQLRDRLLRRIPAPVERGSFDGLLEDLHVTLGQYVRALGLLMLLTFTVYSAFFTLMGVPYGLALAAIAGTLEVIPVVGPLTGAAIAVVVAAVAGYTQLAVLVIFFAVYQFVQEYVVAPRIMGGGLQLHPALVIFAFLAGEELGGVPGMFLSVPVLAVASVVVRHVRGNGTRPPAS